MNMKKMTTIALALAALAALAMPTKEDMAQAQSIVNELMKDHVAANKKGKVSNVAVGDAAMALAQDAQGEAAKLILLKGAVTYYARGKEYEKAAKAVEAIMSEIDSVSPTELDGIVKKATANVPEKKAPKLFAIKKAVASRVKAEATLRDLDTKLKAAPDDAGLRRRRAELLAVKGDWKKALEEFVALGGGVGKNAKEELDGNVAVAADFWWDYSPSESTAKDSIKEHAATLYRRALDNGELEGLKRNLAEKRAAEFEPVLSANDDVSPMVEYKFSYKLDCDNAVITGVDPKPVGIVVVPDKIDGHLVTAFQGYPAPSPFDDCDEVSKVILPAGMKLPPNFITCKSLTSVEVSKANKDYASRDGVLYSKDFSTLFVYPKARESVKLSPKTRKVNACAFRGCALKTAKIPEGIEEIGPWNLCGCPDLELIEFPKSLKSLGPCAAHGNDKLTRIVFNGDAPKVGLAQFSWGKQSVFTGAPDDLVVEVRRGTKGWKSPGSTELPERWPTNQDEARPIRYIKN